MKGHRFLPAVEGFDPVTRWGRLQRIMPSWLEADGPNVPLGTICAIEAADGSDDGSMMAEVVKVDEDRIALVPFGETSRLSAGMRVRAAARDATVQAGEGFAGRAVDALGQPIDGLGPLTGLKRVPLHGDLPQPLERTTPHEALPTGIQAIDGLLTLGLGQRIGIFAASGVGKTSLISQLARQTQADRVILCLVGERGREVEQIWADELDPGVRRRATLVAATSDKPAALRVRAVYQALAIAHHWRSDGLDVLLIVDSATRLAMAMRETGLAAGEPPTVRAFPPSVFSAIPRIVEQCGALKAGGSISAIFTVLSETDDIDDPVSEMMKSLLDGHILLSRSLAEHGHFPAIDVTRSISRNWHRLLAADHLAKARQVLAMRADYEASRTLVESGLYTAGTNPALDAAIAAKPAIDRFLVQPQDRAVAFVDMQARLQALPGIPA